MRCHGTFGGETAKDAHGIDKVAKEWVGYYLVNGLVKGVEGEVQVEEYVRVSGNKGESTCCGGEETVVLSKI